MPGANPTGTEGKDCLLGEAAVVQYVQTMNAGQVLATGGSGRGESERGGGVCARDPGERECGRDGGMWGRGCGYGRSRGSVRPECGVHNAEQVGDREEMDSDDFDVQVIEPTTRPSAPSHGHRLATRDAVTPTLTPTRTPPPALLQDVYLDQLVAFTPEKESWMIANVYKGIGTAYIIGRVYRRPKKGKFASLFQVRWLESQFQSAVEHLFVGLIQSGIENYRAMMKLKNDPAWKRLVSSDGIYCIEVEDPQELESAEICEEYEFEVEPPTSMEEVEAIRNMRFDQEGVMDKPRHLYHHTDGSTTTSLRPEFRHLLEHSASSSFFAYIPVYFWRQVLYETNEYAVSKGIRTTRPFTLQELMFFLGIRFFMALNDKGEFSNYWGPQPEDVIFGGSTATLNGIMTLNSFKLLRICLSFNANPSTLHMDAAARVRPLLNVPKVTGETYVVVGQDVALDEASVTCRSRQGRHLVVYNPMKPTGKYHFRLYVACCSSTWIALNFRLHCNRSSITDRFSGVVSNLEMKGLARELKKMSKIRQLVLEVVRPLFRTKCVINMDNYYTSVQLLQELRLKGLYGRGTIRSNSKHFPGHKILDNGHDDCSRGDLRQAVSTGHNMVAISWCDGNIVNMVSNADPSTVFIVTRTVKNEEIAFPAPTCVREYNKNMQGVDRLDQIRGRFSIADGHSFKRWHKKLALSLIDIVRANAYLTRRLALRDSYQYQEQSTRAQHGGCCDCGYLQLVDNLKSCYKLKSLAEQCVAKVF